MNETRVESTTLRAVAYDDGREGFATGVPQPGDLSLLRRSCGSA
jgi:hypothetical protein